jgi:hypothetical protein
MRIDGDDMTDIGSLSKTRSTVSLTADDQVVSTVGRGHIALSSDDATATNRTFVLTAGETGQELVLEWVGANAGQLIDDSANSDSGNVRLSADWSPSAYGTLSLVCNGVDWIEVGRSAN